jgi:hypothetical protein
MAGNGAKITLSFASTTAENRRISATRILLKGTWVQ